MIKPTIGRIVLFLQRTRWKTPGVPVREVITEPLAAIVTWINADGTLNLSVFNSEGSQITSEIGVPLLADGEPHPNPGSGLHLKWCEWPKIERPQPAGEVVLSSAISASDVADSEPENGRLPDFVFLVVLSQTMDDIPVRMFSSESRAFDFAKAMSFDVPGSIMEIFPECNTPVNVSVVEFRDGVPACRTCVKEYDDDRS